MMTGCSKKTTEENSSVKMSQIYIEDAQPAVTNNTKLEEKRRE
jgi:hypothetical protein